MRNKNIKEDNTELPDPTCFQQKVLHHHQGNLQNYLQNCSRKLNHLCYVPHCFCPKIHYIIYLEEKRGMVRMIYIKATEGSQILYWLVQEFYWSGIYIMVIKPCYLTFTDDTVKFVFERKGVENGKLVLLNASSNENSHTLSHSKQDHSNVQRGLCFKLTYTFCGVGIQASLFITFSGLTPQEMPVATCLSRSYALQ